MVYKVVLLGDSGVGKTNIHTQFVHGRFSECVRPTIGVDFSVKRFSTGGRRQVSLQLWDTAGQERFKALAINTYLKHSDGIVLVYDISKRPSFDNMLSWKHQVDTSPLLANRVPIILVGNKTDLDNRRQVDYQEGLKLADSHSMMFVECSAKLAQHVEQVFTLLVGEIERLQMNQLERRRRTLQAFNSPDSDNGGHFVTDTEALSPLRIRKMCSSSYLEEEKQKESRRSWEDPISSGISTKWTHNNTVLRLSSAGKSHGCRKLEGDLVIDDKPAMCC